MTSVNKELQTLKSALTKKIKACELLSDALANIAKLQMSLFYFGGDTRRFSYSITVWISLNILVNKEL